MSQEIMDSSTEANARRPLRLHHNAWVVADQERTRAFYEDVLGFPLVAFWIEVESFQGNEIVLSHAFYEMEDSSALAFFCMAKPEHQEMFKSPHTEVFNHIALTVDDATQERLRARMEEAGYALLAIDHGYCRSLYVTDPDGLRLEFAVDAPNVDEINDNQRRTAHATLERWTGGDRTSNNVYRNH